MLKVGIPKEIKPSEKRVSLTPPGIYQLTQEGITVFVERGAGLLSGFQDDDYKRAGARIVSSAKALYQKADLIQKVKEPLKPEYSFLRKKHILFSFLHLASPEQHELLNTLLKLGLTAIGYETVEKEGKLPILAPMSQIAGGLAAAYAAFIRSQELIRKGKIVYPRDFRSQLEAIAKVYPAYPKGLDIGRVVIFGGGMAGQKALEFALNLKGKVTLVEKNDFKCQEILKVWKSKFLNLTVIKPEKLTKSILKESDVLMGCVHRAGERASVVFDLPTLREISSKKKKIIMDIAIDQGGNFPEASLTYYENPLYLDSFGNIRFGVANIPSLCGQTASEFLQEVTLPYTFAMAKDFRKAMSDFLELKRGVNVQDGKKIHPGI